MTASIWGTFTRALAVVGLVVLVGCGDSGAEDGSGSADDLHIEAAWAAPLDLTTAADPETAMSVLYAAITNTGDQDDALIGVTSDAVQTIEMHKTVTSGNSGTMVGVDQVDLDSDSTVRLEPGGLHLMLIGPHESLVAGTTIDVRFAFASGSVLTVAVPVIDRADRPTPDHGDHESEPHEHGHE